MADSLARWLRGMSAPRSGGLYVLLMWGEETPQSSAESWELHQVDPYWGMLCKAPDKYSEWSGPPQPGKQKIGLPEAGKEPDT